MAFEKTIQERINALIGESDLHKYTAKEGLNQHLGVDLLKYTKKEAMSTIMGKSTKNDLTLQELANEKAGSVDLHKYTTRENFNIITDLD